MQTGTFAVAIVQRRVMLVQASRTHTKSDRWLDVYTYTPFGLDRVFLSTPIPHARVAATDILTIFPSSDVIRPPDQGMLELPPKAFAKYTELTSRNQKRYENMWSRWVSAH